GNGQDTAVIRRGKSGFACPTHILFNGGVMKATLLRERLVEALNKWLVAEGLEPLGEKEGLDAPDLDHAVARGAAYYGGARRRLRRSERGNRTQNPQPRMRPGRRRARRVAFPELHRPQTRPDRRPG